MDVFDRGQEAAARLNQQALDMHKLSREACQGPGSETCLECGDPIPAARREAEPSATLCIGCQTALEEGMRHHGD